MKPMNMLVLMSDEHNPKILGCYGHPVAKTPHLDGLAARGVRFESAYCNSPICIPARATFATGQYIHRIGYWDNGDPYEGSVTSWHHRLRGAGRAVDSIGKLHFRSTEDDNGFRREHIPLHVVEGLGDLMGLVRDDLPVRGGSYKIARSAGPGESEYTAYDRQITAEAIRWLREEAPKAGGEPWTLFVSWVCPHFPLTAPRRFFDMYPLDRLPWPKQYAKDERPCHPYLRDYAGSLNYDDYFDEEKVRVAIAAYYALCSFLDDNIGQVLGALEAAGYGGNTRIMYTSDHGDNLGTRGLWGKSTMYEETAAVPLILAGPDLPEGATCRTPVSHVDCYPTFLGASGVNLTEPERAYPGRSLFDIVQGATPRRNVFSEYHAMGSTTGAFMIRNGKYKFVYYPKYAPQLFDLEADPEEVCDLGESVEHAKVRAECEMLLRRICDPEEVDARAKRRQAEQVAKHGGRAAVIARGDLGYSPPPGHKPDFR
jgi:choline-sulfatase